MGNTDYIFGKTRFSHKRPTTPSIYSTLYKSYVLTFQRGLKIKAKTTKWWFVALPVFFLVHRFYLKMQSLLVNFLQWHVQLHWKLPAKNRKSFLLLDDVIDVLKSTIAARRLRNVLFISIKYITFSVFYFSPKYIQCVHNKSNTSNTPLPNLLRKHLNASVS